MAQRLSYKTRAPVSDLPWNRVQFVARGLVLVEARWGGGKDRETRREQSRLNIQEKKRDIETIGEGNQDWRGELPGSAGEEDGGCEQESPGGGTKKHSQGHSMHP